MTLRGSGNDGDFEALRSEATLEQFTAAHCRVCATKKSERPKENGLSRKTLSPPRVAKGVIS